MCQAASQHNELARTAMAEAEATEAGTYRPRQGEEVGFLQHKGRGRGQPLLMGIQGCRTSGEAWSTPRQRGTLCRKLG